MADAVVLQCSDLVAGYGGSTVLNGASIAVRLGSITGIVGSNGAGKSTLLKTILGYLKPVAGAISYQGNDITAARPDQRIAAGIAYVAQSRSGFPSMTIRENLRLGAYLVRNRDLIENRQANVLDRFPELKARLDRPASDLSGGQLRMLEIGRFLMQGPSMVILDEPSIGLSPKLIDLVYREIEALRAEGLSFLIVEQNVKKLLSVADHVYALENGRNHVDGSPASLEDQNLLQRLFLGAPLAGVTQTEAAR